MLSATIENGELVVRVPMLGTPELSSTGKTKLVAKTGRFLPLTMDARGNVVSVNVTATVPRDAKTS